MKIDDGCMSVTEPADELVFVDDDIRKAFENKTYYVGTPTQVQLMREIRRLREVLEKTK